MGRAVALAALDMTESNPWSRLTMSEHCSVHGVRDWVRRYLRSLRGGPRLPRNASLRSMNRNGLVSVLYSFSASLCTSGGWGWGHNASLRSMNRNGLVSVLFSFSGRSLYLGGGGLDCPAKRNALHEAVSVLYSFSGRFLWFGGSDLGTKKFLLERVAHFANAQLL